MNVTTIQTNHTQEKSSMEADFDGRLNALKIEYEQKMADLNSAKDQEREQLRAEM